MLYINLGGGATPSAYFEGLIMPAIRRAEATNTISEFRKDYTTLTSHVLT